jgi:hypothetical protein
MVWGEKTRFVLQICDGTLKVLWRFIGPCHAGAGGHPVAAHLGEREPTRLLDRPVKPGDDKRKENADQIF